MIFYVPAVAREELRCERPTSDRQSFALHDTLQQALRGYDTVE
jgi:hypothetical protein